MLRRRVGKTNVSDLEPKLALRFGRVGVLVVVLQEFFSLAWSSVMMSRGDKGPAQLCSILAAGGKRGVVKLIHPRNNVAYGEFRASRKALSVLRFHERQGNLLFSESRPRLEARPRPLPSLLISEETV